MKGGDGGVVYAEIILGIAANAVQSQPQFQRLGKSTLTLRS